MAEYYALLTRAVGRLQSSNEVSRREVYVKARNALIQQLKAINPPLSPAEISKQRLELEEAIRKVERDSAAQQTQLSDAEISRTASMAMEEALATPEPASRASFGGPSRNTTVIDEAPVALGRPDPMRDTVRPTQAERRQATTARGWPEETTARPEPARPAPAAEFRPMRPAVVEEEQEAFPAATPMPASAPVAPPPPPPPMAAAPPAAPSGSGQPKPAAARLNRAAGPAKAAPPAARPPLAEERPAGMLADADAAAIAEDRPRKAAKAAREPKKRRSIVARLIVTLLTLAVLGGIAVAAYLYWDEIKEFIETFGSPPTNQLTETPTEGEAAGLVADPADGVRQVGPIPPDALPAGEVQTLGPGQAFLYEEGATDVPGLEGTAMWRLIPNAAAPEINVVLAFPDRGLSVSVSITENNNAALLYTHEISVLVTAPPDMPHGAVQSVEILATKSTEDAVGDALVGVPRSIPPDFFYFELSPEAGDQNLTRMRTRGWFDLGFTYADGTRAIFTFEKAPQGEIVFREALAAWAAN